MTTDLFADRPQGLMSDLDHLTRPVVRRLPDTRALDVLDQMYAYHDAGKLIVTAETAYDVAA